MILESIVVTQDSSGITHITPLGVHLDGGYVVLAPFRPSRTLDNLVANGNATVNFTDDVRVFAGCLTGRRDWPVSPSQAIITPYLGGTLTHLELEVEHIDDDASRPRIRCRVLREACHAPFRGFNRAQAAVVEAAILVSRLHMLPAEKIDAERAYLTIAVEKTAGPRELEAWGWLMERIDRFRMTSRPGEVA